MSSRRPALRSETEAHALAVKNLGLIPAVLRSLGIPSSHWDDARQEAYFALYRAARRWDSRKGAFSTIAGVSMRRQVLTWWRCNRTIHLPSHAWAKRNRSTEYWAAVKRTFVMGGDKDIADVEQTTDNRAKLVGEVRSALRKLDDRDAKVIDWRLDGWSLAKIGRALGCTRERVRQLQDRAIERLRILLDVAADRAGALGHDGV